jgi:glyoxylase-like metal-dependent hydrolase (beta-lactamase superfamily II)
LSKPILGEPDYTPPLLCEFADGKTFEIDGETITAIHTPGHTNGSAAYLWGDVLFAGVMIGDLVWLPLSLGGLTLIAQQITSIDYRFRFRRAKMLNVIF